MRQSQKIHIENFGEQKIVPNNDISEAINSPENRIFIRYEKIHKNSFITKNVIFYFSNLYMREYIRMLMTHTAFKVG